jgi:hypothetical protein
MDPNIENETPAPRTQEPEPKKLFDPDTEKILITTRKDARFYIFLAKIILKKFGGVELSALGRAADITVRVAENLERYGYAKITKCYSETISLDDKDKQRKGAKFFVALTKTDQFDTLTENMIR